MVGKTLRTPVGIHFTAAEGHFFRFVAHKLPGARKGFVEGYSSPQEVFQALAEGRVSADQISGWEDFRVQHLPILPDLLQNPDFVLLEKDARNQLTLHFIKRYHGAFAAVGYVREGGIFAPLSFSPRQMKPGKLNGLHLMYASTEMKEGMQNTLPALPLDHSGIWQGQDPGDQLTNYPLIDGNVNPQGMLPTTQGEGISLDGPLSLGTVIEKDQTLPGLLPSSGSAPSLIRPRSKSEYHSSKLQLPYMHETDSSESSHPRTDAQAALRELTARAENDAGRNARADAGERIRAEAESLVSWARDGGWLVHGERFQELRKRLKSLEGGAEHDVHAHPLTGRVIKTTKAPNFGARGNLVDYLHNIAWSNELFHDDIVFEGVVEGPDGPSVIISQPFILGTSPTEPQIIAWMEAQGYIKDGYNKWRHPDTGAVIADTHPGNFILDAEGYLVPIDLQVLNPGKSPRPPSS